MSIAHLFIAHHLVTHHNKTRTIESLPKQTIQQSTTQNTVVLWCRLIHIIDGIHHTQHTRQIATALIRASRRTNGVQDTRLT